MFSHRKKNYSQSDLIAVDPETFEVVRQIQALRNNLNDGKDGNERGGKSSTSTSATATAVATATADASGPAASLSDEKLINLFLLIARGGKVPTGGAGSGSKIGSRNGSENGAGATAGGGDTAAAAATAPGTPGGGSTTADGEDGDGSSSRGGAVGGHAQEVMGAVEAMFAFRTQPSGEADRLPENGR